MAWVYPLGLTDADFADGETSAGWAPQSFLYGSHIAFASAGSVSQFGVRGRRDGGSDVGIKWALYDDDGNLVANSTGTFTSGTNGWVDSGTVSASVSAATYYLMVSSATSSGVYTYSVDGAGSYGTRAYADVPADPQTITEQGDAAKLYAVRADFTAVALDQDGFRFGNDDGSESAHGWAADEDTDLTAALGSKLLRVQIDATGNPAAIAYTLRSQKNGAGGYVAVPTSSTSKVKPVIETGDCTTSGNNTASTTWSISHPNASSGDLLVYNIAWDDSTTTTGVTPPSGPNGETFTAINSTPAASASTEVRNQAWYTEATGSWTAGTTAWTPSASEQWVATVIRVPSGEFDSTTPIGGQATNASTTTTDTEVDSAAITAGSTDGGGALIYFGCADADELDVVLSGWTPLVEGATGDIGAVALGIAVRDTEVTNSESISSEIVATIASDSWCSVGYIIRAPTVTNPVYVSASSNIAAGGEATTARLTAPGGKTTGDFVTGRRWDDENGTDTIDITTDDYTEVEWTLTTQSPATNSDYFEFRVYQGAAVLSSYVTPKWTIGSSTASLAPLNPMNRQMAALLQL